jgi:hypothetical protein
VDSSFEQDNDPSGSVKFWEIRVAELLAASQEGLNSMELVS